MSAETLREAAKVLRERAEAATPSPWSVTYISKGAVSDKHIIDRWFVMGCFGGDPRSQTGPASISEHEPDADYIATMHPGVGLALADWLDKEALFADAVDEGWASPHAGIVARLILGGGS